MAIARSFGKWYGIFPPYRLEAWDKRGKWRAYGKAGGGDYGKENRRTLRSQEPGEPVIESNVSVAFCPVVTRV